jgi:phosphate starvation-inducible protein PhoH
VVRHPLVQKIINAYEDYDQKQADNEPRKNWFPASLMIKAL